MPVRTAWLRLLLGAAVAAMLSALACGGDNGGVGPTPTGPWTLVVRVLSQKQEPIAGATVTVLDGPNANRSATTDSAGTATLSSLTQSGFTLQVAASGFFTTQQSVTLTSAQTLTVSLTERPPNNPPVISALIAQGTRANEPAGFADQNEEITVTATVTDDETPVAQLTFEWTADAGTFAGSGPTVKWRAPASGPTPETYSITLTVTERVPTVSVADVTLAADNKVSRSTAVRVHKSEGEIGALSTLFLTEFSDSNIAAATVVRNFADKCNASPPWDGKADEFANISDNRRDYKINSYRLGAPTVAVNFGTWCSYGPHPGDACIRMSCEWWSTKLATGALEHVSGTCHLTTVYESQQWKLCWSSFEGVRLPNSTFIR